MGKRAASFLLAWILSAGLVFGEGRAYVLSLQGEGSATVLLDEAGKTAFIHDGGRADSLGVVGARIEGKPVLAFLQEKQVSTLVISCSHPHADHMDGLVDLLEKGDLKGISHLYFVDALGEGAKTKRGKPILPLHRIYEAKHTPPPSVRFASAVNADAFSALGLQTKDVQVRNFIYDPKDIGSDVHDQSVIVEYDVKGASGAKRTIVDFDDASTALIDHWAASEPPRRADVLLMAHHGSRYNDMASILLNKDRHGLTDVIFTADDANRFLHPTPESLSLAIEAVTADHLHITGSKPGDAVEVYATGELVRSGPGVARARLETFVAGRIASARLELPKTRSAKQYLKLAEDIDGMSEVLSSLPPAGERMHSNGVVSFQKTKAEMSADQAAQADPSKPDGPAAGLPASGSAGGGFGGGGGAGPGRGGTGPGRSSSRYQNFGSAVWARSVIRFGGIVIGNEPKGAAIAEIKLVPGSTPETVLVQVPTAGGVATFGPVSTTQLWVAYNYVAPTERLRRSYEGLEIEPDAGALAGMVEEWRGDWKFALHPAIADTTLAADAMRLDMAVATADEDRPEAIGKLPWDLLGDFSTYQWFDEPSEILIDKDRVSVKPGGSSGACLMRLRLLEEIPVGPRIADDDPELARFREEVEEEAYFIDGELDEEDLLLKRQSLSEERAVDKAMQAFSDLDELSGEEQERLREAVAWQLDWDAGYSETIVPPEVTEALCEGLPFLKRMDGVAKLVALFHRYLDTVDKPLPPIPPELMPKFVEVEAQMSISEVWDRID